MDSVIAWKFGERSSPSRSLWLQLTVREAFRSAAADLQNASIFWVTVLLLLFPYRALPELYSDLGVSLARFEMPQEGLTYGLFLIALSLGLKLHQRSDSAYPLAVRTFADSLPVSRIERFLAAIVLRGMGQIPILFIQITAAITLILLPGLSMDWRSHVSAQAFGFAVVALSILMVRTSRAISADRLTFRPRLPGALGFILQNGVRLAPIRFLLWALFFGLAVRILSFRSVGEPSVSAALWVALVGLCSWMVYWAFQPWRLASKPVAPFFRTLPTFWLRNATGERLFSTLQAMSLSLCVLLSPFEAGGKLPFAFVFTFVFPNVPFWIAERVTRWSFLLTLAVWIACVLFAA